MSLCTAAARRCARLPRHTNLRPIVHVRPRLASTVPRPETFDELPSPPRPHTRPPPKHRPASGEPNPQQEAAMYTAVQRRRWLLSAIGLGAAAFAYMLVTQEPHRAEAPPETKPGVPVALASPSEREKALGVELIPSGTSSVPPFPRTLRLPEDDGGRIGEYALVGLGIRTVSFLGIQVYVVGFYVHADDLAALQKVLVRRVHPTATTATQQEREELKQLMLDPERGSELFEEFLTSDGVMFRSAFRVVPTRNTDFHHLRDGWVRGIQSRSIKSAAYDDDAFAAALNSFKALFNRGSVPKQKTLLLYRDPRGVLSVLYDASGRNDGKFGDNSGAFQKLGDIRDDRISRALWLCYLAGKTVASPPARESIVDGLLAMVERPSATLGTAAI